MDFESIIEQRPIPLSKSLIEERLKWIVERIGETKHYSPDLKR
jgi:hypothetical protein